MKLTKEDNVTWWAESESRPDKKYLLYYNRKLKRWVCDCEDSLYRLPNNPEHICKHQKELMKKLGR